MIKKNIILIIIAFFVLVPKLVAQDKNEGLLLKEILEKISIQHKVNFNFIEDEITSFKIIPPKNSLSLFDKLDYITQKTQLKFIFVSGKYISVVNNQNLDKTVCGYLYDDEAKLPIENASIHIKNSNNYAISNPLGFFELQLKSTNEIEISHLNYDIKTIQTSDFDGNDCLKIYIKNKINELNIFIFEEYLTKGIIKKRDGTFEINPKKQGLLPGLSEPDVFQTIQQIPGINITDGTISNMSIRGGTHDQNLFLWNGIQLYQTGHFFGLISVLNPNLTHKITLSKNGTSSFYGNGVSSSVLISTQTDSIEKSTGAFGINMINVDFYTKLKTSKKSNLEISGRRSFTDLLSSSTYKNYYNKVFQNTIVTNNLNTSYNSDVYFYFYDLSLQYHQKIKKETDFFIDVLHFSNDLDINQSKNENNTIITKQSVLDQETYGANVMFKTNWNPKNSSKISIYTSYFNIQSENQSIQNNQIFNQENTILDIGIKLENNHILSNVFSFSNGYQYNEIGIRNNDKINSPTFSRNNKHVLRNHAIIGELKYLSKNDKFLSTFGIRQNYIEQFQSFIFEPRIQLNYKIAPFFSIEFLAEKKHQVTSQIVDLQKDFLGIEKRRWVLSNNNAIPIIKSNQVSLGFLFSKKNWLLTVDNFYKKVDGITSMTEAFQNQFEFIRTNGSYTVYGTEFLTQKKYKNLMFWVSYAFTQNDYTFKNLTPSSFPNNFEIKHTIKSAIITNFNKLDLSLGAQWFTGKPTTLPISLTPIYLSNSSTEIAYSNPNSTNLKNFFQINLSGSYDINLTQKSKMKIGFSIQNLLNSKTNLNQFYRINSNSNSVEQVNTYALKRTPNIFVRYSF
ncbi:TonB-dependent receptor plug domain-containing protein [Flavobacterium gelidilacus]